jgi:hypothetical protein
MVVTHMSDIARVLEVDCHIHPPEAFSVLLLRTEESSRLFLRLLVLLLLLLLALLRTIGNDQCAGGGKVGFIDE